MEESRAQTPAHGDPGVWKGPDPRRGSEAQAAEAVPAVPAGGNLSKILKGIILGEKCAGMSFGDSLRPCS